ncbi:phage tail protein [Bifidobacterium sp. ESL0728]|uniref:phage tail spike protein n=1 Tax=Bifidobacterium sp. ESL0728 TaxID=2983220 RepID=UPI0023F6C9CB|nr:phage tail spike protein [Bifidobacterium sp. ESL0728]WEV59668.1 phage tail protein [Bifidobacterium sp. ESL0728]
MRFMLFDRESRYKADLSPISAVRTRNVDGTDKLELTLADEVVKGDRIVFEDSMGRWVETEIQSADCTREDGKPLARVVATSSVSELSDVAIVDRRNRGASASDCLAKALEGTRWEAGTVQAGANNVRADLAFYHTDTLSAIQSICDTFGLEMATGIILNDDKTSIDRRRISLLARRGRESTTRRFEYGKDLLSIRRTIGGERVKTRLYGYGAGIEETDAEGEATGGYTRKISFDTVNNGLPYVQDDEAVKVWGIPGPDGRLRHTEGFVEFPDCKDPTELLRLTRAKLRESVTPQITYEASVQSLAAAGLDADGIDLGDSVQIVDTSFPSPLRLEGRVLELKEDLLGGPSGTTITLGNIIESITQRNARVDQAIQQLTGHASSWDDAATLGSNWLNSVIAGMNEVLNRTGGYAYNDVPGEGIMIYNRPRNQNPTQALQLSGGFWRCADGKNSQGQWNWRTMANGHGLIADALYAGTITGGKVKWDLTQGVLKVEGPDGVEVRLDASTGFSIWQNGKRIGGIVIKDGQAFLQAARAGTTDELYLTTGLTTRNNPGTSLINKNGEYAAIEALTAVDGPQDETNGVGMACFAKPFLQASTYYRQVWLYPPEKENTYLEQPDEQVYLNSDTHTGCIQISKDCGLFMDRGRLVLQLDATHWVGVESNGVQCRCGPNGFGWVNGKFSPNLQWK